MRLWFVIMPDLTVTLTNIPIDNISVALTSFFVNAFLAKNIACR